MKVSATLDWDNLNAQEFAAALEGVESETASIDDLDDGDVVAFMRSDDKKGIIQEFQIIDPGSVSERYMKSNMTISYKLEL